jgi:hypothetical protein
MGRISFSFTLTRSFICIAILSFTSHVAWAQSPTFATQVPAVANEGNTLFILLPVMNTGTGTATAVQATSITLGQLKPTTPSSLPLALGNMAPGAVSLVNLAFTNTTLIIGNVYLLTLHGTYVANGATFGFSVNRFIKFGVPTIFQLLPSPLNVIPTPDLSHAVTQMISALNGGTISATRADGTVFTVTFPPNALLSDETITMTPVISVAGLPISGGFVAGVQLTPDGLELFQPAHLTIQPAVSVPINQQIGFSYHGDGREFFFYPLDPVTEISFTIQQLSGYGLGAGNVTQRPIPTNLFDRLESEIQRITAPQRQSLQVTMLGQTASESVSQPNFTQLADQLQNYYEQVVQPQLQQAERPGGSIKSDQKALDDAGAWAHQVAVIGLDQEQAVFQKEIAQFINTIATIAAKDFNTAYTLCFSQPGPDSVALLIRQVRLVELFGGGDPAGVLGSDYLEKINKCAHVTLTVDFDSEASNNWAGFVGPPGGLASSDSVVQAAGLILKWNNPASDPLAGAFEISNAPLNYLSLSIKDGTFSGATYCTVVKSFSSGNSISVAAKPSLNVFSDGTTLSEMEVSITPQTGEQFIVGVIDERTGRCILATPIPFPVYVVAFFSAGGDNPFSVPLNSAHTFKLARDIIGDNATARVTLKISVNPPNP